MWETIPFRGTQRSVLWRTGLCEVEQPMSNIPDKSICPLRIVRKERLEE